MKKILACSILLISLFLCCKKVDNSTGNTPITPTKKDKISGLVQKGPYIIGTKIEIYELDDKLAQTGKVFNTEITDDKGTFKLDSIELSSKYVQLSASGFYFNESSNSVTTSQLQLSAITDITDTSTINVNILTHLEKNRVEYLLKSGQTFSEAKKTAQQEILAVFGFQASDSTVSEKLDISKSGDANAVLLAVSLIIQGNLSVVDLSDLLTKISSDIEQDGLITDTTVTKILNTNAKSVNLNSMRQNLVKRYEDLGVSATIPNFEKYFNEFLVDNAQKPSIEFVSANFTPYNISILNGIVNPNGAETIVTFEYGLTSSYGSTILAKESPLYGDTAQNVTADILNLDSLTTYHYRIKAENGKGITYSADSTFTTIKDAVDLVTGLVAYYPFNGNANDESGNGRSGIKNQVSESKDRFGNLNSAYYFDGFSSYIEINESATIELGGNDFSISVWINCQSEGTFSSKFISKGINSLVIGTNGYTGLPNTGNKYGIGFDTYGKNISIYPDILPKVGWNHIVCVKTKSGYDYYVNNFKYTMPYNEFNIPKSDIGESLFFGKGNAGAPSDRYFKGYLDEIYIYNRALTQAEITYLATH